MRDRNKFIERRVYPRYPVSFPVKYQVLENKGESKAVLQGNKKQVMALVQDISLNGMKVSSEEPCKVGDVLVFEIHFPAPAQSLLARAEVVWVEGDTSGLHSLQANDMDWKL
ncbi:MAG TPA: PilZ domain-containing protein [bacterium]|nr:PilZ domain-containing protein [bacterium]